MRMGIVVVVPAASTTGAGAAAMAGTEIKVASVSGAARRTSLPSIACVPPVPSEGGDISHASWEMSVGSRPGMRAVAAGAVEARSPVVADDRPGGTGDRSQAVDSPGLVRYVIGTLDGRVLTKRRHTLRGPATEIARTRDTVIFRPAPVRRSRQQSQPTGGRQWPPEEECTLATASSTKLRPLGDRVVIKPTPREEMTKSGIVLPDTAKEKPQEGLVLSVGPGKTLDDGSREAMDVAVGNKVLYAKYAGTEFKVEGEELLIVSQKDILAIVED
jgi:chaperonin GroES